MQSSLKNKIKKIYCIFKSIIFISAAILIFIFSESFIIDDFKNLPILVGSIMCYYGLEAVVKILINKNIKQEAMNFFNGEITILLGIIVLTRIGKMSDSIVIVGILWAVWAIMRESEEIFVKVVKIWDHKIIAFINLLESLVVIYFSVSLMLNPIEHHIFVHVILLGIELILEILFELYIDIIEAKDKKNS